MPALFVMPTQRWLLCANHESQRMFDEELDGMGFLLKEWPWHWGRETLLADICTGRKIACDQPFRDCKVVGERFRAMRRHLTPYEQVCFIRTGEMLAHALEATCRAAVPGNTERELAGQIAHRLCRHGVTPLTIAVAADGVSAAYRRHGYTSAPVQTYAVLAATARKYGLHVAASRSFSFGTAPEAFRQEHLTAAKIAATFVASTWPDAEPKFMFNTARRVYVLTGYDHEWQLCPQGHLTGRAPIELQITPDTTELLRTHWAVTWGPSVGAAQCCDTYLVTEHGPVPLTPAEEWPQVGLKISGVEVFVPHVLER
jgi:Xaa-Pro aminopeptidase